MSATIESAPRLGGDRDRHGGDRIPEREDRTPETRDRSPDTNAHSPDTNAHSPDTNAHSPDTNAHSLDTKALPQWAPRLLEDIELIGQVAGSGLREPPYLVRRGDGQIVQLSRLLYVIASHMDGNDAETIASRAGAELDLRITPEQIAFVAEQKLAPLGLVTARDGSEPPRGPIDALLGLRFRAGIVPERAVNAIAKTLRPLFLPPVVAAALAALVAFDVWLGSSHGIGSGVKEMIQKPVLGLALFGLMIVSMAFHESGHATACRYGGARPGRIGVGLYVLWPAFYTDVTDSYRLDKIGRLRTDLGGVYFNALFALAAAAAYFLTAFQPLLVLVVSQQLLLVDQFIPWMRLDGYHVVSDLIGVSDLFERIKPVISSLLPGRDPHPRVTELKPWARAAVTIWVLTTICALAAMGVLFVLFAPGYLGSAWRSLIAQLDHISHGVQAGSVVAILTGAIGTLMLSFPITGILLTYLLICRRLGASIAYRRARVDLTLAAAPGETAVETGRGRARERDRPRATNAHRTRAVATTPSLRPHLHARTSRARHPLA
jgi:putative peptide zinc metalloprotease protein